MLLYCVHGPPLVFSTLGEEAPPFVESGQAQLAAAMGDFASNASSWSPVSDFVGLGDNFYTCGIDCGPVLAFEYPPEH